MFMEEHDNVPFTNNSLLLGNRMCCVIFLAAGFQFHLIHVTIARPDYMYILRRPMLDERAQSSSFQFPLIVRLMLVPFCPLVLPATHLQAQALGQGGEPLSTKCGVNKVVRLSHQVWCPAVINHTHQRAS